MLNCESVIQTNGRGVYVQSAGSAAWILDMYIVNELQTTSSSTMYRVNPVRNRQALVTVSATVNTTATLTPGLPGRGRTVTPLGLASRESEQVTW